MAQLLVNAGGVSAIIDYLGESSGTVRLPGIMTLGYVAAHSENLAMTVIVSKGVSQLAICLGNREKWKQISIVDQERVCADPQATLLIFLFCRLATNLGL